jgi:hypothetical protein
MWVDSSFPGLTGFAGNNSPPEMLPDTRLLYSARLYLRLYRQYRRSTTKRLDYMGLLDISVFTEEDSELPDGILPGVLEAFAIDKAARLGVGPSMLSSQNQDLARPILGPKI